MILNQADNIMLGSQEVSAVYCNSVLVWQRQSPPPVDTKLWYTTVDEPNVWNYEDYTGMTSIPVKKYYQNNTLLKVIVPECITLIDHNSFANCQNLQSIVIHGNVKNIVNPFQNCISLSSVTLEEGVETIESWAFMGCTALTEITIPSSVTQIASMSFTNCSNLAQIVIKKPQNSLTGSPWGANNAVITWIG